MSENRSPVETANSTRALVIAGLQRGFPIFLGYIPLGFAWGVLAVQNGISPLASVIMSLFVYTGAAQFIAVGLIGMGASVLTIVITSLIVNLRNVLMSAALAPWLAPFNRIHQCFMGWGLTDEIFAAHSAAMNRGERASVPLVYSANFLAHSGWVLGTVLGAVAGNYVPDPGKFGLDFALPAMFMALLAPLCRDRLHLFMALFSGAFSVMLVLVGINRWNVILTTLIAATLGTLWVLRQEKRGGSGGNAGQVLKNNQENPQNGDAGS